MDVRYCIPDRAALEILGDCVISCRISLLASSS